tara:strand:- start:4073 stop:7483 length:3411 start_codon:yes stop_codon:yes gene_type:complete
MAIRKIAFKQNLIEEYDYLTIDEQPFSDGFFNIVDFPEKLKAGKNLFKIRTNTQVFVDNSLLHIEAVDFNGNPIYVEPLQYIEKDGTRVISLYIYPDTSPGLAQIYIAGRLEFFGGQRIPFNRDFNSNIHTDIPNVIWQRSIPVAPTAPNDSEIIFVEQPSLTISEVVQPYLQPVNIFNVFAEQTSSQAGATLIIDPIITTIGNTQDTANQAQQGGTSAATPTFATQFFDFSGNQEQLNGTGGSQMVNPPLNSLNGDSLLTTTNFPLKSDMEGGILEIRDPFISVPGQTATVIYKGVASVIPSSQLDNAGQTLGETLAGLSLPGGNVTPPSPARLSGSMKFAITSVLSSTQARIAQYGGFHNEADNAFGPFAVRTAQNVVPSAVPFGLATVGSLTDIDKIDSATDFTASFIQPMSVVFTENSSSFADIIIANTEPETGDVYRIKTLYKPSGFFGDFIDLGDTILERQNILIDTASLETSITIGSAYERFGNFESLQEIEKYWETSSFDGNTINSTGGANVNKINLAYNEDILIGGGELTMEWAGASDKEAPVNASSVFNIQKKYRPKVFKNTTYILNFQVGLPNNIAEYSTLDSNITNNRMDVYISGSTVTTEPQFLNITVGDTNPEPNELATLTEGYANGKQLGNRIGTIRSKDAPGLKASVTMQFRADQTGEMDIKFVTRKGSWLIGEIEILADKQTGFSPNYVRVFKRIPTEHLKTPLTFKFQYFDFRGNKADLETVAYGAIFNGGNLYVQGNNNLITGSTYVASAVGTGIEMSGGKSGYLRSTKYEGFISASEGKGPAGWLMWSGSSALKIGADTYEGVGLELIANSESFFRYRSTPSEVIIKTDKFFLGSEATQFVSGANGNIEISSSFFHLTTDGNIKAQGGTIGGTTISSTTLQSTETLAAPDGGPAFQINSDGIISGSDLFVRQVFEPAGGSATQFVLVDTTTGKLIGRNIGRQVVQDTTEYERKNVSDGASTYTTVATYVFSLMPYEDTIIVNADTQAQNSVDTTTQLGKARFQYARAVTGSYGGASSTEKYDEWESLADIGTYSQAVTSGESYDSRSGGPGNNELKKLLPDASLATKMKIELQLQNRNTSGGTSNSKAVRIKNISIIATSAFAGDFSTPGELAPSR